MQNIQNMQVQYKILDSKITPYLPKYATSASAGMDLHALLDHDLTIKAGQTVLVSTGLAVFIENAGYVGLLMPRSGLGHKHGIILGNTVGVIDADYQGELKISLFNRSAVDYTVKPFERIAQFLVVPVQQIILTQVEEFTQSQDVANIRGTGGFGSTGR